MLGKSANREEWDKRSQSAVTRNYFSFFFFFFSFNRSYDLSTRHGLLIVMGIGHWALGLVPKQLSAKREYRCITIHTLFKVLK